MINPNMMDFKDTRKHIKHIIREMIGRSEIPSVNSVMTEIVRQRRAAGVDGSPSTTTVHSEIKDYFENEFWPVFRTYKGLSEVPEGLSRAHEIFQDGFSRIVLSCVELANIQYKEERAQNEIEFQKICSELETVKRELAESQHQYSSFKDNTESTIHQLEINNHSQKGEIENLNKQLAGANAQALRLTQELAKEKQLFENEIEQADAARRKLLLEIDSTRLEVKSAEQRFTQKCNELAANNEQIKNLTHAKQELEVSYETLKVENQKNIERIGELRGQLLERERVQEKEERQTGVPLRRLKLSTAASIKSVKRIRR